MEPQKTTLQLKEQIATVGASMARCLKGIRNTIDIARDEGGRLTPAEKEAALAAARDATDLLIEALERGVDE